MDSFSLYRCKSGKPHLELTLKISGKVMSWVIPNSDSIRKNLKRLAIEMSGEEGQGQRESSGHLSLIEEGDVEVKYQSKRKIIFSPVQTDMGVDEFVLLIPSWGIKTKRKMWVLITS